jgi:hypothetical protein
MTDVGRIAFEVERLTRRQLQLALIAETGVRPDALSEWEIVRLLRISGFQCWRDSRELEAELKRALDAPGAT